MPSTISIQTDRGRLRRNKFGRKRVKSQWISSRIVEARFNIPVAITAGMWFVVGKTVLSIFFIFFIFFIFSLIVGTPYSRTNAISDYTRTTRLGDADETETTTAATFARSPLPPPPTHSSI